MSDDANRYIFFHYDTISRVLVKIKQYIYTRINISTPNKQRYSLYSSSSSSSIYFYFSLIFSKIKIILKSYLSCAIDAHVPYRRSSAVGGGRIGRGLDQPRASPILSLVNWNRLDMQHLTIYE
jgi:hypothetical protein